jgi:hypothetical protein
MQLATSAGARRVAAQLSGRWLATHEREALRGS